MAFETIILEKKERIAYLTFNRPDVMNAISEELTAETREAVSQIGQDDEVLVLVVTGAGRAFMAGADIAELTRMSPYQLHKWNHSVVENLNALERLRQPVIAAINGFALGGGLELAMACDIRIASENAKFNNAFIKIGVSGCDLGSSYFLPRLIGLSRATEILYTGRFFDANEADRIGFVSKVVPSTTLLKDTINLAEEMLLTKSPLGLRLTKEGINKNMDAPALEVALDYENRNQVITANTKDAPEGVISFFEKRPPKYGLR